MVRLLFVVYGVKGIEERIKKEVKRRGIKNDLLIIEYIIKVN